MAMTEEHAPPANKPTKKATGPAEVPRAAERPRLQIDFTPEAFEHLKAMRERANVKTSTELAKNALRLYDWFLEKREEGYTFLIEREEVVKQVELLL